MNLSVRPVKLNNGVHDRGHDGLNRIHVGEFFRCPALYGQYDVLVIHIVSLIIRSSQRHIADIVGPST